jgi:hypothetical protein
MLAALALQVVLTGTVDRTDGAWTLTLDGEKQARPLAAAPGCPSLAAFKGKRVQIIGERDAAAVTARLVEEVHPAEKDLVLKIKSTGVKATVFEYLPSTLHKHPGRTCKSHAWARATVEARDGAIDAEIRVPAYVNRLNVRVFVRVEGKTESKDADDASFNGGQWLDRDLKPIEKPVDITLDVR